MGMASDDENELGLSRTLIYGRDKTKKSWWACRAAEFGYNVILLDGDDGRSIVRQLPAEAKKRILTIDAVNTREKAVFALFMASFCRRNKPFLWDETTKSALPDNFTRDPLHSYVAFDTRKFTANDVVIIDSWTALAASTLVQFNIETGIDATTVQREGDQFAHTNFQARFLDHVLNEIHTMPCHIIVVGHEQYWERYRGVENKKKGLEKTFMGTFVQPISSTGPQGDKLGKHFSNVLHFSKLSEVAYRINAGGDANQAGGSRILAPKVYDWKEITPATLFEAIGAKSTGEPCRGAAWIPKGSAPQIKEIPLGIDSTKTDAPVSAPKVIGTGNSLAEKLRLRTANGG